MIFDWEDFRTLAEELCGRDTESAKRTAISRIYYSIYWKARNLLEDEGFIFRQNDSSHRQIWEEFQNRGLTYKAVSKSGSQLHRNRVSADYFSEIQNLDEIVERSFNLAENIRVYLQQIEKKTEN